jgi:gluconate kinase
MPHVVVMGVSGCGKTTVGRLLARHLEVPFIEGDELHPPRNVELMAAGIALTDEDRAKFTAEELEEYETFRSGKMRSAVLEREYAAKQLLANVELVSQWLSSAPHDEAVALGAELQKPLKKLRRQIDSLSNTGDEPAAKRIKRNDVVQDDDGDDD